MENAFSPKILEQHGRFVRALARALVRDPGRADDVAQEALTRWVVAPPPDAGRARGWLATVVRRIASNLNRAERRRGLHEQRAARTEVVRSPLEENEQAELVQRVVAAVMALEPEQRDTILARYFRGVSTAELARESGVSENTLRSRERRALETLRGRLDREHASRAAWALGLMRLARPGAAPTAAAGSAGALKVLVGLGGVAAVAAATLLVRTALVGEPPAPATRNAPAVALEPAPNASLAPAPLGPARGPSGAARVPAARTERVAASLLVPGAGSGSAALQSGDPATVRARFRLSDGSPAAGVSWQLSGWSANEERVLRYGEPAGWVDPEGTTAADGSLEVVLTPPRAFQFTLDVKAPQHAAASWRWDEIEPGQVLDLGTIELVPGGTVEGHLVNASGAPVLGQGWTVYLTSRGLGGNGRDEVRVIAPVDPQTGAFRAEDVLPGLNDLEGYSRMANWVHGQRVTAVAGATVTADLVYSGPDNATRITLSTLCRPLYVIERVPAEHVRLVSAGGESRTAQRIAGSSQSYSFEGLAPGLYTLEIDDPRFLFWSQGGIAPGTPVQADLEPSAAVHLAVSGPDGQPIDRYALSVEFQGVSFMPREIGVSDGSAPLPGGIVRVPPGDFVLRLKSGTLTTAVPVPGILAGETRFVTASFAERSVISGIVRDASGEPLAGVELRLLEPAQVDDSETSPILAPNSWTSDPQGFRRQLASTESDAAGAFEFTPSAGGSFLVRAGAAGRPGASSPVFALAAGASRTDLELVLARGATVSGTVHGPGGASCAGLRLWLGALPGPHDFARWGEPREACVVLDEQGHFSIGDLPGGTLTALLFLPADAIPGTRLMGSFALDSLALGTLEVAPGATLTHDFDTAVLPGTLAVEVVVNDAPAQGVHVELWNTGADGFQASLEVGAGPQGHFAPLRLFPGSWRLRATDPEEGWSSAEVPVQILSAESTSVMVPVTLATGSVRLVDASGQPHAGRGVRVSPDGFTGVIHGQRRHTDADGRVTLTLAEGSYRIALASEDPGSIDPDPPSAVVLWTSQGPQVGEVQL